MIARLPSAADSDLRARAQAGQAQPRADGHGEREHAQRLHLLLLAPVDHRELLDALAQLDPVRSSLLDLLARVEATITNDVELIVVTPRLTLDAILRMRLLVDRGVSVRVIALLWDDEALDHLGQGAALGLKIVEIGPTTNLTMALQHEVGGGLR